MRDLVLTLKMDNNRFYAETSHGVVKEIDWKMYGNMLRFCSKEGWKVLVKGEDFITCEGWSFFD